MKLTADDERLLADVERAAQVRRDADDVYFAALVAAGTARVPIAHIARAAGVSRQSVTDTIRRRMG